MSSWFQFFWLILFPAYQLAWRNPPHKKNNSLMKAYATKKRWVG